MAPTYGWIVHQVDHLVAWAARQARRASPRVVDALVAGVVAVPTGMDAWWNEEGTRQADGFTYGLLVASIVALLFRRRWPIGVALTCGGALTGWYLLGHHGELLNLPVIVALYTIAVEGNRRVTLTTALVAATWSGILGFTSDDPVGARGGSPVLETLMPLVPLALGEATRLRRELVARAEAEREREARRRVEAERIRIAQEFHDLVAHTMAAVNVHMGVAVAAFETNPAAARAALGQARASSKEALQELRATVALLRDAQNPYEIDAAVAAPTPRLGQIDELAETARAAGIAATVQSDAGDLKLPAAVELAAYRIVQEALTNVVRHSNARHVAVALRCDADRLVVDVTDDGTTARGNGTAGSSLVGADPEHRQKSEGDGPSGRSAGFGLVGMAERAAAVGGRVEHGQTREGGFRVHAVLPAHADRP